MTTLKKTKKEAVKRISGKKLRFQSNKLSLDELTKKKEYLLFVEGNLEQFYNLEEVKADYFNGFIIMNSPASIKHEEIFIDLVSKMHFHVREKQLGKVLGSNALIVLDDKYRFEPDIVFISSENAGIFTEFEFVGVPDMVVEILSKSTRNYDLYQKRAIYKQYQVKEIIFIDQLSGVKIIDSLDNETYIETIVKNGEVYESRVLPDLKL
jgi:Uma2 family endonuclease